MTRTLIFNYILHCNELDEISLSISEQLSCQRGSITSIDFGAKSRASEEGVQLYAPQCHDETYETENVYNTAPLNGTVEVTVLKVEHSG